MIFADTPGGAPASLCDRITCSQRCRKSCVWGPFPQLTYSGANLARSATYSSPLPGLGNVQSSITMRVVADPAFLISSAPCRNSCASANTRGLVLR